MKKAIVIGSSGQDGYYLCKSLIKKKYRLVKIDYDTRLSEIGLYNNDTFNIRNPSQVESLILEHKPDEIYFLAAFHHSAQDKYEETLEILQKSIETHETSLYNFLSSINKFSPKSKLFYAASSLIFGEPSMEIQTENTPINPINIYGITKASGLFLCRKFRAEHDIFASCGILYNHESIRRKDNFLSKRIVDGVIRAQKDKLYKLEIGKLDSAADWGYAPDYVEAMTKILDLPKADDFIIATGIKKTVRDFVSIAFLEAGLEWQKHVIQKPGILNRITKPLIGDPTKLKIATGWVPSLSFEEMVKVLVKEGMMHESK